MSKVGGMSVGMSPSAKGDDMTRSKTRARLRAALPPVPRGADPMDDDSGRTAARMDYLRRSIRRRLKVMAAARAEREARRPEEA